MKRLFLVSIFLVFCLGLGFSQSQGRTMFVAVNSAELKASTGFFANTVGTLPLGSTVTVVRESGKWTEIRAGSLSGWVASASLTPRRVTGQGHSATVGEIALAGKGFSIETEVEYRGNGLDFSEVDSMESLNISKEELLRFITDGRLSRGE